MEKSTEIVIEEPKAEPTPESATKAAPGSSLAVFACFALIAVTLSRAQEIFPGLASLRPNLFLLAGALGITVMTGRLSFSAWKESRETKLMTAFWILAMLAIPLSVYRHGAFNSWLYGITTNVVIFFCTLANSRNRKDCSFLVWAIPVATAILLLGAGRTIAEPGARISTTSSYDPNDLAMVLCSSLPFMVSLLNRGGLVVKGLMILEIALTIVLVMKTGSRGSFLGLAVLGLFLLLAPGNILRPSYKGAIVAGGILVVILANPETLWGRFREILDGSDYNLTEDAPGGRIQTWKNGVALAVRIPAILVGVGVGQFSSAMGDIYGSHNWITAHNSFLQIFLETGLPGLVLFIMILSRIWKNTRAVLAGAKPGDESYVFTTAHSVRMSLITYLVCGLFLSQAYTVLLPILLAFSANLASMAAGAREAPAAATGPGPEKLTAGSREAAAAIGEVPGTGKVEPSWPRKLPSPS